MPRLSRQEVTYCSLRERQSSPRRLLHFPACRAGKAIVGSVAASSAGGASLPQTPSNRRTAEAVLLHCWFSRALRSSRALIVSSLASPRKRGGRESFLFGTASSLARSRWSVTASCHLFSLIVAAFSGLALTGGPESLLLFTLTWGGFASPHPT